jgi:hypothetical protein
LSKNVTEIGDKNGGEQKNGATPQLEINFPDFRNVAHAYRVVKTNEMPNVKRVLPLWIQRRMRYRSRIGLTWEVGGRARG